MTTANSSWTEGYVAELDYTHGYYREMSPSHLELAMMSKQQAHSVGRQVRYLELGFGQGVSLNIHAAACGGEFWGTDFNPSQAANAREMAAASGANVHILDQSFAELASRDDLPEFDIITLHGIWSWISDENRRHIAEIARRRLAVGGLLYVSYNSTPGWSAAIPLRHLMALHLELASAESNGLAPRIDAALGFAEQVIEANALYFKANPAVAERLKGMKKHNRNYLAHEFFNADWHPMPFSEVAEYFASAKLSFAAPANLMSHIDAVNLTVPQQQLLASISHPVLRESVRDYCENQQFRRDVFVKGPRGFSPLEQAELVKSWRFVLTTIPSEIGLKIKGAAGEAELHAAIYKPLIEALAANKLAPKSVQELAADPALKSVAPVNLLQALVALNGLSHAAPARSEAEIAAQRPQVAALNAYIIERSIYAPVVNFLASPVTGGGIPVGRLQQLMLRAIRRGKKSPQEMALDVWTILEAQGQRVIRDGKSLDSATENVSELTTVADEFVTKRLPVLEALCMVEGPGSQAAAPGRSMTSTSSYRAA
ncbi:MAG: class I SAM-dependent methyltransferase [Hyphomicrobium sp.]|jgi:hypothetical protein